MWENCHDDAPELHRFLSEPTTPPLDCTAPTGPRGKISIATRPDPKLTTEALWAAIDQARAECFSGYGIPDGWITQQQYMTRHAVEDKKARTQLAKLVAAGKLQTRMAVVGGYRCRIWGLSANAENGKGGENRPCNPNAGRSNNKGGVA